MNYKNATAVKHEWTNILMVFGETNVGRKTRLGVFANGTDYWLEDGLPLLGIDIDPDGDLLTIELMLANDMTHPIENVVNIEINLSIDPLKDGLDITDAEGKTTVLRFEN